MYLFVCGTLIRVRARSSITLRLNHTKTYNTGVAAAAQLVLEYIDEWKYRGPLNTLSIMDLKKAEIPGDCNRHRGKHK